MNLLYTHPIRIDLNTYKVDTQEITVDLRDLDGL